MTLDNYASHDRDRNSPLFTSTMSSATPTRKRALSAEASPEFLERDAKKVRVSVTPSASTSRGDKKRRRKKKKTTPVVDYRGVERKGSVSAPLLASDDKARANGSGSQPSSPPKSTTGGSGSSEPNLERSLSTAQVERLLDPAVGLFQLYNLETYLS